MSKDRDNPETEEENKKECTLKKDPKTGLLVLSGPSFTKEDIAKDFPDDSDRDSRVIRRSVGL